MLESELNMYEQSKANLKQLIQSKENNLKRFYNDLSTLDKFGINLRSDADHPNDIRDEDFAWEEIEELYPEFYNEYL